MLPPYKTFAIQVSRCLSFRLLKCVMILAIHPGCLVMLAQYMLKAKLILQTWRALAGSSRSVRTRIMDWSSEPRDILIVLYRSL
jgi:hypothetical protein